MSASNNLLPASLEADIVALVINMADEAREIARSLFRTDNIDVENKSDNSPVTVADKAIEKKWRDMIADRFPDHSILGEEYDDRQGSANITWVLDPIDGTRQFVYGMPLFGSLIGVCIDGKSAIGCIEIPMTGERWLASPRKKTTHNGQPAQSSKQSRLDAALLMATALSMFSGSRRERFSRLAGLCQDLRLGTDCYAFGLLASGHCDLVAEANLKAVDVMALIPVLEGAGSVVTDWNGLPYTLDSDGTLLASANPTLHALALNALGPRAIPEHTGPNIQNADKKFL